MRKKLILLSALLGMSVLPLCSCDVLKNDNPPIVENGENEQIVFILGKDTLNYTTVDTINEKKILDNYTAYDDKGKVVVPLTASVESYDSLSLNFKTEGKYEVNLIFTFGGNKTIKKHITINITKGYNGITKDLTRYNYIETRHSDVYVANYICEKTMNKITVVSEHRLSEKMPTIYNEKTKTNYKFKEQTTISTSIKSYLKFEKNKNKLTSFSLDTTTLPAFSISPGNNPENMINFDTINFYFIKDVPVIKENANFREREYVSELKMMLPENSNIDLSEGLPEGTYPAADDYGSFVTGNYDFSVLVNDKGEELVIPFKKITHKNKDKKFYFLYNNEKYYYSDATISVPCIVSMIIKDNKMFQGLVFKNVEKQNVLNVMPDIKNIHNYTEQYFGNSGVEYMTNFDFIELKHSKITDIREVEIISNDFVIDFNLKPTM